MYQKPEPQQKDIELAKKDIELAKKELKLKQAEDAKTEQELIAKKASNRLIISSNDQPRQIMALLYWSVPWVLTLVLYLLIPGFMMPFFEHPVAQKLYLYAFIWETFGCLLLLGSAHKWLWTAVAVLCVFPAVLIPLIGPAIITIMQMNNIRF